MNSLPLAHSVRRAARAFISFLPLALLLPFLPLRGADAPAGSLADTLLASVARDVTDHFNAEGALSLEVLRPWQPGGEDARQADPAGWSVRILEFPAQLSSSMLLRVRVVGPAGQADEHAFVVRAQLWRDAWVARTPIERGATLDPSAFDLRRVDALRDREALSTALPQPGDWTFQRAVPAGRLLSWRDVSRRARVRKGDLIEVAAIDGPLQVTMKAQAMQDGGRGETVRVRNLDSKREFAALVVAPNRAEVRF
jgi:flagella basal body P-ring formation protein FlgA